MSTAISISPVERAAQVLELIQSTTKNDSGARATLKRSLTGEPRHLRAAYPFVLRFLGEKETDYNLEQWLLVTALYAYAKFPDINPEDKSTFGNSARRLKTEESSGGPERRFRALLETSLEDVRSPLTAMARLMKSKGIAINYPQLLVDLCRWDHPDQYIQDKWARAFWGAPSVPADSDDEALASEGGGDSSGDGSSGDSGDGSGN